jgi:outer membrane protein assembly factor BamA
MKTRLLIPAVLSCSLMLAQTLGAQDTGTKPASRPSFNPTAVSEVAIWGLASVDPDDIRPRLRTAAGRAASDTDIAADIKTITAVLRKKGFYRAKVTVEEGSAGKGRVVIFRIVEGDRTKVGKVIIEGLGDTRTTDRK